jgi:hypothetical protein
LVISIRVVQCVCWWYLASHHNPPEGAECLVPIKMQTMRITKHCTGVYVPWMLKMHKSMVHNIQVIDLYTPCVVSKRIWNNEANMAAYCGLFFLAVCALNQRQSSLAGCA